MKISIRLCVKEKSFSSEAELLTSSLIKDGRTLAASAGAFAQADFGVRMII